jgi:hypothetical protein
VLDQIGKRGAGFKSLKDTWADTTTAHGRLMLTVLGGLAEFERELIRARTSEGRKRAKERGAKVAFSTRQSSMSPRVMSPHLNPGMDAPRPVPCCISLKRMLCGPCSSNSALCSCVSILTSQLVHLT